VRFWKLIEPFRADGYHFRKQVPLGPFVVDFACHRPKLVIEIDGDTHYTDEALAKDRARDASLARHGFTVLRFTNDDVMTNPEGVYLVLASALTEGPLPSPPLKGEGDIVLVANSAHTQSFLQ
jgi:very-short-patch-repair endonuclease